MSLDFDENKSKSKFHFYRQHGAPHSTIPKVILVLYYKYKMQIEADVTNEQNFLYSISNYNFQYNEMLLKGTNLHGHNLTHLSSDVLHDSQFS